MDQSAKFKIGDLVRRKDSAGSFGNHHPGATCKIVSFCMRNSFRTDGDSAAYALNSYELSVRNKSGFGQFISRIEK